MTITISLTWALAWAVTKYLAAGAVGFVAGVLWVVRPWDDRGWW